MATFEVGTRVKLVEDHEMFTDDTHKHTVILKAGLLGVIVDTDDDDCKYDEVPGPYRVQWDNGTEYAHFYDAAQPATEPAETGAGDYVHGYLDMMGATPHPDARTRIGELLQRPAKAYSDTLADKEWESAKVRDLESQLASTRARLAAVEAALRPFAFCPIHPGWDDDTRCVILMNWNKLGLEVSVNEGLKLGDVRKAAAALQVSESEGGE